MSFIKKCGLTLLTAATFQTQAASVWKVSSGDHTLYIGGTVHMLTPDDYPLPHAYEQAYQAADKVVFETDINAISKPEFRQQMQEQLSFTDGTTIGDVITPSTYDALKDYLTTRHVPIEAIQHLKPSSIAMTLTTLELKHMGFISEGVDQFYANKALQDHKPQAWLETPDAQIKMLSDLNKEDSNSMVQYALDDIKDMTKSMSQIRKSWREGDLAAMEAQELTEFRQEYPEIYQELLVKRNNTWMPQIQKMLTDKPVEFIMVGTLHLAGPDSLLAKLQDSGYQVEKL